MANQKLNCAHGHKRVCGVTLIEVLVALLVLSVGLIGIASLNLFGLKAVHSSLHASAAAVVALDVEEWLWEALGNGQLGDTVECNAVIDDAESHWFSDDNPRRWLPQGLIERTCDEPVAGSEGECWISVGIQVTWLERRFTADGTESFRYRVQLPCNSS